LLEESNNITHKGDKRHIQHFLRQPTYKNTIIPIGMLFLAKHLSVEEFRQCIDYIYYDHIWLRDDELTPKEKREADTVKEELKRFKSEAFINELKKVDFNSPDNGENKPKAIDELLTHFKWYESEGVGRIDIRANAVVSGLRGFLNMA
jgi:hypothetical protein